MYGCKTIPSDLNYFIMNNCNKLTLDEDVNDKGKMAVYFHGCSALLRLSIRSRSGRSVWLFCRRVYETRAKRVRFYYYTLWHTTSLGRRRGRLTVSPCRRETTQTRYGNDCPRSTAVIFIFNLFCGSRIIRRRRSGSKTTTAVKRPS